MEQWQLARFITWRPSVRIRLSLQTTQTTIIMSQTIEQKAGATLTQRPVPVFIGKRTYMAPPPTVATIILVAELIAELPEHEPAAEENILFTTLALAKDARPLGTIAAVLVLGFKRYTKAQQAQGLPALILRKDRKLADYILTNSRPAQLSELITKIMRQMEISDFFALTTSLGDINLLRRTKEKEVVTPTN